LNVNTFSHGGVYAGRVPKILEEQGGGGRPATCGPGAPRALELTWRRTHNEIPKLRKKTSKKKKPRKYAARTRV